MHELVAGDFLPAQPPQPLGAAEIHLWFFPQWEGGSRAVAESLPLRALLAGYLDCAVSQVRIERGEHGKPRLSDGPLQFNLAHSGGKVLVALGRGQGLGVDLETPRRKRPVLELARRWFDPAEAAALAALPENELQNAFLLQWSCKEAVLKALGRGIGFGLDRVVFGRDGADGALHLHRLEGESTPALWQVVRLQPVAGSIGALAWRGPARPIRAWVAGLPAS